ncbi:unnamed protein product [Moneuplotes crassus]|uniref:Transmembrane protein n=1 Tax=Euplotes crassus TaxID=5936 RepID=A0AAD1UIQ7_EUPCR|nr:unnamed protein product [Moneuplotes crassus]
MASSSQSFSFAGVCLLLISVTLIVLFMYLLAINMKYIKELSYKIKIIIRAAFEKDSPLHKYKKKIEKSKLDETFIENIDEEAPKENINPQEVIKILKSMADKGRSAKFCDILRLVMEKYNHLLMWPFTRKSEYKKYDLLRPLSRFYNLLNITGLLIIWTVVVFLVAATYTYQTSIDKMSLTSLLLIIFLVPLLCSPIIIICIHLFYRIYMDTIKKVFSQAYHPEKYMKEEQEQENSIICAVPVQNQQKSESDMFEEVKDPNSNHDHSDIFQYEGGEECKSYGDSQDQSDRVVFPSINHETQRGFVPETDQIYNSESSSEPKQMKETKIRRITDNDSISDESNPNLQNGSNQSSLQKQGNSNSEDGDEDLSVYEVQSDDDTNQEAKINVGLMESESRSNENLKTILIFIGLFSILAFAVAICCHVAFNLSSSVTTLCILIIVCELLDLLVFRNIYCLIISIFLWCKKRKHEKKLQKYLEIVIQKYLSEKWDKNAPLGGFNFKNKRQALKDGQFDSENNFIGGEKGFIKNLEHENGRDITNFQFDETNENAMKLREDAEARRQALLLKMRSTNNSNAFTETESKAMTRRKNLKDPDGVLGINDDMSDLDRPAFQRQLNKDEIDRILAENPEIADEFDNERQRWLEFGEEDNNNINPLSDYNTLLVSKMQKGYDKKADGMIDDFRKKEFNSKLAKIEEERINDLDDLEMDKLEMQGKAVAFQNSEGIVVRKKIKKKRKGKGKKKGKMFVLDTPYGRAKYYKRPPSPEAIDEEENVIPESNCQSKKLEKAKKKTKKGKKDKKTNPKEKSFDTISGSSAVEGDTIMFETGLGPQKVDDSGIDGVEERDMVVYDKDDMTNFSRSYGLNKMQSRLSLMNWAKSQEKLSTGEIGGDSDEDQVAQFQTNTNFGFNSMNSPEPKAKLIQKKPKRKRKKRKTKSISVNSFRRGNQLTSRSVLSSIDSRNYDSENNYSSEEDNPNDRSGLLSFVVGKTRKKKGKIKKKNKWVKGSQHEKNEGRKSFRQTTNLSKNEKDQNTKKSKALSYEDDVFWLSLCRVPPKRFKDVYQEDNENFQEERPIRRPKPMKLPSEYTLSPNFTSASKPPLDKPAQRSLNFNKPSDERIQKRLNKFAENDEDKKFSLHDYDLESPIQESPNEVGDTSSLEEHGEDISKPMFQRNNIIKSPSEDTEKQPKRELLFSMNKDFHMNTEKLQSVDSRTHSKDGSRAGSKGRTYIGQNAIFSQKF